MSMDGGNAAVTQTINPDGTFVENETLSGLAGAIYTSIKASNLAKYNELMATMDEAISLPREHLSPSDLATARAGLRVAKRDASLAMKQGWAKQANELGPPIVAYLQAEARVPLANVKATVSTSARAGRLPSTLNPGDPIDPPSAAVLLPVTGDAGATELPLT